MSIEAIKQRIAEYPNIEYVSPELYVDDTSFLLEQNQRLVEALERIQGLYVPYEDKLANELMTTVKEMAGKAIQAYKLLEKKD